MKIYSEIELREMIANLRLVKEVANEYELQDKSELDLTTYELLLENHLKNKTKKFKLDKWKKEMDEFLNELVIKNGTTDY